MSRRFALLVPLLVVLATGGCRSASRSQETGPMPKAAGEARAAKVAASAPASQSAPRAFGHARLAPLGPSQPSPAAAAAARRGARWLVAHREQLPRSFVLRTYRTLYRIVGDPTLSQALWQVIAVEEKQRRRRPRPKVDLSHPRFRRWHGGLTILVNALLRRQCDGEEIGQQLQRLRQHLDAHEAELFPADQRLGVKIVAMHDFVRLGIRPRSSYEGIVEALRTPPKELDPRSPATQEHLYALTHVVFTASDYFDRYVDPGKHRFAVAPFRRALTFFRTATLSDSDADLAAEILTSLRLMRLPQDDLTRAVEQRLVARQRPDGSWGAGSTIDTRRVHHTMVTVFALLPFPERFRGRGVSCTYTSSPQHQEPP